MKTFILKLVDIVTAPFKLWWKIYLALLDEVVFDFVRILNSKINVIDIVMICLMTIFYLGATFAVLAILTVIIYDTIIAINCIDILVILLIIAVCYVMVYFVIKNYMEKS